MQILTDLTYAHGQEILLFAQLECRFFACIC